MYAQRDRPDEKKAGQAAKKELEKGKRGEKKVAEEPPRKKRGVQKFPSITDEDTQKGKWLTDEHIHFAQSLLRAQFPHVNGLQCMYCAFRE